MLVFTCMITLGTMLGDADAKDFAIRLYGVAMCFDAADEYFDNLIVPILWNLSAGQLENMIEYSN